MTHLARNGNRGCLYYFGQLLIPGGGFYKSTHEKNGANTHGKAPIEENRESTSLCRTSAKSRARSGHHSRTAHVRSGQVREGRGNVIWLKQWNSNILGMITVETRGSARLVCASAASTGGLTLN